MFINLIARSIYSIFLSSIKIDDIINFAINNKQQYVSLVDHNVMYGCIEFYNKAKQNNLKPIIGLSLDYKEQIVYLFARNYEGYLTLCQISSIINKQLDSDWTKLLNDNVIVVSNNLLFDKTKYYFNCDDLALHEALFAKKQELDLYKALIALRQEQLYDEVEIDQDYKNKYLIDENEANKIYSQQQLKNLEKLLDLIDIDLHLNENNFFINATTSKKQSQELLLERCKEGLKTKLGQSVKKQYIDQLKYELEIIHKMNFDDYFLVVQDYVMWAKQNDILVGPGRGSAAGSLVSYVLDITNVDPLQNNLIFERFLNPQRKTMPDIDVDFMDSRRNEVVDYIISKYGSQKVAHIITFQTIKIKSAIREAGRLLNIDLKIINNLCKQISNEFDFEYDEQYFRQKKHKLVNSEPLLFEIAFYLVGLVRQPGTHAAGIVIGNKNLDKILPITLSVDGLNTTQYSMEYIESTGLIKMDILGLVNLSIINDCLKLIHKHQEITIDLNKIPLNDQNVFNQLSQGKTLGIFQLESPGMTNLVTRIKPKCIEDISIASALFRPGPQQNINKYLSYRANPSSIEYIDKRLEKYLHYTSGIIIYQEQVIQCVQEVANFSIAEADSFRRAISKKKIDNILALKEKFINNAIKNNYSLENANKIFDYILSFANYGFNHSHSLAYSYIGYQMAFLKYYYPLEFYTCLLTYNNQVSSRLSLYINEAKKNNISILQPDINNSSAGFSIYQNKIIFGLTTIKGIGFETINKIICCRNKQPNKQFDDALKAIIELNNEKVGQAAITTLIKAGCFNELLKQQNIDNATSLLNSLDEILKNVKFAKLNPNLKIQNIKTTKQIKNQEALWQQEMLGIIFSQYDFLQKWRTKINKKLTNLADFANLPVSNQEYLSLINIVKTKTITTSKNVKVAFITLADDTAIVDNAVAFKDILDNPKYNTLLEDNSFLLVKLIKSNRSLRIKEIVERIDNE